MSLKSVSPTPGLVAVQRCTPESVPILKQTSANRGLCTVALAALGHVPEVNYRSWLMDTGCRHDLTSRASVPDHQLGSIFKAPIPIVLATANGLSNGYKAIRQQIGELGEVAEPYILESTPDVLSIGRRCVEDGCEFHWAPYSLEPTIVTANGKVVTLRSHDCCPYLDDYEPDYINQAAAAVAVKGPNDESKELTCSTRLSITPTLIPPEEKLEAHGNGY